MYDIDLDEQYDAGCDCEIEYHFDTAWAPSLPVIKKMGEMFPLLTFDLRYFEAGMAFNGMLVMEGGKVETEVEGPYFGGRGG